MLIVMFLHWKHYFELLFSHSLITVLLLKCYFNRFSTNRRRSSFSISPVKRSTTCPFFTPKTVGIPVTWCCIASSGLLSISTFASSSNPSFSPMMASNLGVSPLHGVHQSAWKSTRTGFVEARTLFWKSSLSFTSKGVLKYDVVVMCADVPERYFGENNALWWDVKRCAEILGSVRKLKELVGRWTIEDRNLLGSLQRNHLRVR